jgi:hypothetical protein
MGSFKRSVSVLVLVGTAFAHATAAAQTKPSGKTQTITPAGGSAPGGSDAPDALSDDAELARVVSLVEAAKYEQCVGELDRLLDPKGKRPLKDPAIIETARVYQATCYIGLGQPDLADEPLRQAIRKNPDMRRPDSLLFPQRVIDRWISVKDSLVGELRAAEQEAIEKAKREAAERLKGDNERWAQMLMWERLARQEIVVVKNRRWIAAVPFGVGQFQNGDEALGWIFFGTEAALGLTALTSLGVHTHLQTEVDAARERGASAGEDVNQRLSDWHLALELSTYGLLAVAALGIAESQLSFVPEVRTVRERPLPKAPPSKGLPPASVVVTPRIAGGPGKIELGIAGRF